MLSSLLLSNDDRHLVVHGNGGTPFSIRGAVREGKDEHINMSTHRGATLATILFAFVTGFHADAGSLPTVNPMRGAG
jgi:hypothetical protein